MPKQEELMEYIRTNPTVEVQVRINPKRHLTTTTTESSLITTLIEKVGPEINQGEIQGK